MTEPRRQLRDARVARKLLLMNMDKTPTTPEQHTSTQQPQTVVVLVVPAY